MSLFPNVSCLTSFAQEAHCGAQIRPLCDSVPPHILLIATQTLLEASIDNRRVFTTSLKSHGLNRMNQNVDNDVINHCPPDFLRSTLRSILGSNHTNASIFVQTIRANLQTPHPIKSLPDLISILSDPPGPELTDLLIQSRIRFASHLIHPAFLYLAYLPRGIVELKINLQPGKLYDKLVEAGGDMVQAAQALKESNQRGMDIVSALRIIIAALQDYRDYSLTLASPNNLYPFARALNQLIDAAHIVFPDDFLELKSPISTNTITISEPSQVPLVKVRLAQGFEVPRLFFGLWQLSSPAWGSASQENIMQGMSDMISNGLIAADMAGGFLS